MAIFLKTKHSLEKKKKGKKREQTFYLNKFVSLFNFIAELCPIASYRFSQNVIKKKRKNRTKFKLKEKQIVWVVTVFVPFYNL